MPLFECSKCGCVENTALGNFWAKLGTRRQPLCSECSFGKWHNGFLKINAKQEGYYKDNFGFIHPPSQVDLEKMEWVYNRKYKIVGKV